MEDYTNLTKQMPIVIRTHSEKLSETDRRKETEELQKYVRATLVFVENFKTCDPADNDFKLESISKTLVLACRAADELIVRGLTGKIQLIPKP